MPGLATANVAWRRLHGPSKALAFVHAALTLSKPLIVVVRDSLQAERIIGEIAFFLGPEPELSVFEFPDWETLPYDRFSPFHDIVSARVEALAKLPELSTGILVVSIGTLIQRLAPRQFVSGNSFAVAVGETVDRNEFRRRLTVAGYRNVDQVTEHGEYSIRGELIDVFPMGGQQPFRLDFFDDEVESIRVFEPESQRSVTSVDAIKLLPAREFPLDDVAIERFRGQWRKMFPGNPSLCPTYNEVGQGIAPPGIEYYLPLFFEQVDSLFDYLPEGSVFAIDELVHAHAETIWESIQQRFESRRHDHEYPLVEPEELYLNPTSLIQRSQAFASIECKGIGEDPTAAEYATEMAVQIPIDVRAAEPMTVFKRYLGEESARVLLVAETGGRRETILELLQGAGLRPTRYEGWQAFLDDDAPLGITVAEVYQGVRISEPGLVLISETQLFGERASQRRRRKRGGRDPEAVFKDLTELQVGSPVVHELHGIGRYQGLVTLDVGSVVGEYLNVEYADQDRLYVPVSALHLVSRYGGFDPDHAPLHKLGSGQWERAKEKAAKRIHDVAAELLDVHARRAARRGHSFEIDEHAYGSFSQAFPFEETPDQETSITDVLKDMCGEGAMDRLICGDVGFGKTEVAMRAAFVAVSAGWQVIVLVPTTLLAQQHYQNFSDRFADWPVVVEQLSRFRSKRDSDKVIEGLASGLVDIVIGTHKLLQTSIKYKRLGLVIIDEEHRFGVRQKERLKALRAEVDVLTLTATPIPRTLNLALAGARDMSIIATPPARRQAIKTFVRQWEDEFIREALQREISRGGQVYFLHNQVRDIEQLADQVRSLLPEVQVRVAHGQMPERELEKVMLDFYHRRFTVLVCTTIIESGIDVPSANTIIINRADRFGLAQLYQLRGRVGRSHHRAYAYLVVPHPKAMMADARKRLEAIESLEELGVGFTLATHDLEIRGAGELLGDEQSGHIQAIGFGLYNELLLRAVKALKAGLNPDLDRSLDHGAEIDLHTPALIPDDFLPDVHTRLILYKRIASAEDADALMVLREEMIDRFGTLPAATLMLFTLTGLKLKAMRIGVNKIDMGPAGGRFIFNEHPDIDPGVIVELMQTQSDVYRMEAQVKLRIRKEMLEPEDRVRVTDELLETLATGKRKEEISQ